MWFERCCLLMYFVPKQWKRINSLANIEKSSDCKTFITPPPSVRPDQVPLTQAEDQQHVFDWDYPSTWNTPRSFFPLLFQVKVVRYVSSCDATDHFLVGYISPTSTFLPPRHLLSLPPYHLISLTLYHLVISSPYLLPAQPPKHCISLLPLTCV